jgi:hypothetical protein
LPRRNDRYGALLTVRFWPTADFLISPKHICRVELDVSHFHVIADWQRSRTGKCVP